MPKQGDVFFDHTRPERSLRLSRHPDAGVVVLSIWNGGVCQATFQLPGHQAAAFVQTFLNTAPPQAPPQPSPEVFRTGQYDTRPTIP